MDKVSWGDSQSNNIYNKMASKVGKRMQSELIRSAKKNRRVCSNVNSNVAHGQEMSDGNSSILDNRKSSVRQQQNKEKHEKESTSPLNVQVYSVINLQEKGRRVTRSFAGHRHQITNDLQLQNQQLTPEHNHTNKLNEQPTLKKGLKTHSAIELSDAPIHDITLTIKKVGTKELQPSPYGQIRKSYRKVHRREIISIPYRKCHDIFEGRIVSLLNKMESGRNCLKDLQNLIERLERISVKDMMNRYIVSGISSILWMAKQKKFDDVMVCLNQGTIIERLVKQEQKLFDKIQEELERVDMFENVESQHQGDAIDVTLHKQLLLRKLYKLNKKKYPEMSLGEIRTKTIRECDKLFNHQISLGSFMMQLRGRGLTQN